MDTKKILFTLSAAFVMNAYADNKILSGTFTDTVRVIGVFNQTVLIDQHPHGRCGNKRKFIQVVTKSGNTIFLCFECSKMDQTDPVVPYIERGDTLIINNKGDILKNLTMERLKSEFVKGR